MSVVSDPSFLMCLAAECNRCAVAAACGHLGESGAGGVDRLVGRRRRSRGHGGGGVADAPLFAVQLPLSGTEFSPEIEKVNMSSKFFVEQ